jgi:hypothetical protein
VTVTDEEDTLYELIVEEILLEMLEVSAGPWVT